jgi:hypothetical protein
MLVFCIGEPTPVPGLHPPRIHRWQQQLEHLCNGQAYDQVERAIRRQSCTLLYGDVWRVHQAEMRARFPDAVWIRTSSDVGDDGPYLPLSAFTGSLSRFTCKCAKALVSIHCDFSSSFAVNSNCFLQHNSEVLLSIFVDSHTAAANPSQKTDNIAWIVEPYSYQGSPVIAESTFAHTYVHGLDINGHVPVSGTWIPPEDYLSVYEKTAQAGIILSTKTFLPGHALRHTVVASTALRGDVVANGSGVGRPLISKTPGIAPFMYAIVIENCIEDGYWTEKLVDSLLLKCVVFYWGAQNVHDWFLPESVIPFSTVEDLHILLDTMSFQDYASRRNAVELNYHRAQAWTYLDDGILLETNFMSSVNFDCSPCVCKRAQNRYVSAKLMGGLGNQLFQMAAAFGAQTLDEGRQLVIHTPSICGTTGIHTSEKYKDTVFGNWPQVYDNYDGSFTEQTEDAFVYRPLVAATDVKHLHLNGFFQHEQYFKHCFEKFADKLQLPMDVNSMPNTCFVHVRLGDFLTHSVHNVGLQKTYLPTAIAYVLHKRPDAKFLVFSDDIEKCKQLHVLQDTNVLFCEETDAVRSLVAMSKCELGGICWNSSFSWWGAYLNPNPDKIVTFPDRWMNNDWQVDIQFKGSVLLKTL